MRRPDSTGKDIRSGHFPVSGEMYPSGKAFGSILEYDVVTGTYKVQTEGNKRDMSDRGKMLTGVPRKQSHPGEHVVLDPATAVIVDFSLGFPYIDGVLPKDAIAYSRTPDTAPDFTSLDAGEGATPKEEAGAFRDTMSPKGMLPGDHGVVGPDGNYMATLRGKINKIYSSEQAQIITMGLQNLIRVVCENYEQMSSFGVFKIENKNGRSSLSFRGAADQLYESGGSQEYWTFRLDVGDEGRLFSMRITSPDNSKTYAEIKITPDGYVEIFGEKGVNIAGGGERRETVGGDVIRKIQGGKRETIGRNKETSVTGDHTLSVQNVEKHTIGLDHKTTVGRNQQTTVSGQKNETIMGGMPTDALPTNDAVQVRCVNGSYKIQVGNPLDAAVPTAFPGYKIYVYNGGIILGEDPMQPAAVTATVSLNSLKPNSIGLGCIVPGPYPEGALNPPTDYAMLYSKWLTLFNTMLTLLDSHTHTTTWGPSGPAMAPAPGGFNTALAPLTAAVKSLRVMMGA